jgi:uncharacterized DUF497 family protein
MQIEFDPAKDLLNQAKHGISLTLAAELDWDDALVWADDRFGYGELRRIISLRRADRREVKRYVDSF